MGDEDPALPSRASRESTIRRDAEGCWFHEGVVVEHPSIRRAFDRWIDRAEDGRYCLRNAINWVYVAIEGAPIFVRSVALDGEGVSLSLSDERIERLAGSTLRQGPDGALYCDVRSGSMPARFTRGAAFALGPILGEDARGVYVRLGTEKIRPEVVLEPLDPIRSSRSAGHLDLAVLEEFIP